MMQKSAKLFLNTRVIAPINILILTLSLIGFASANSADSVLKLVDSHTSGDSSFVDFSIEEDYHVIANIPGDEFLIPFEAELYCNQDTLKANFPKPLEVEIKSLEIHANWYTKHLTLAFEKCTDPKAKLWISFQTCTETMCLPPAEILHENLFKAKDTVKATSDNNNEKISSTPSQTGIGQFVLFLFFAFVGGFILNFMPCVLPVLSLKIFSLIESNNASKKHNILSGLSFGLGILVSFWTICGVLIFLQTIGQSIGWGFQFTYPKFVFFVFLLVFIFGLNLLGLFEITLGYKTNTALDKAGNKSGYVGSFFKGVFMTLLSTPCSAPFLGTSMGYALSQPPLVLILFFTSAALGLAFPFVLISFFPSWIKFLPKPGNWMLRFKEIMGFIMLVTAIWLLSVMGSQIGLDSAMLILYWSLLISICLWIWKNWGEGFMVTNKRKLILGVIIISVISITGIKFIKPVLHKKAPSQETVVFNLDQIRSYTDQGKWVFVDYTADWCLSCKVNEKSTITNSEVEAYFERGAPHLLKADYTSGNASIDKELRRVGRAGVPLYILYGPNGDEYVFPEVISPQMLIEQFKLKGL